MKKIFSFFTLLIFIIIGFFHNSMMAFAMQSGMHKKMMGNIQMHCCDNKDSNNNCEHSCCISGDSYFKITTLNNTNFQIKILKIKLISFIDIFAESLKFLENKNLINKTSPPPNLQNKIKYYSYSDLIKIIKSNT